MIDYVAQKEFECIPWIEGVEDVLVALRDAGVPSMLVTTSPRHLAENLVAQAPAGAFAGYVCGDDDVEKKPSPAPYLEAGSPLGHRSGRYEVLHCGRRFHVWFAFGCRFRCDDDWSDRIHADRQFQRPAVRLD